MLENNLNLVETWGRTAEREGQEVDYATQTEAVTAARDRVRGHESMMLFSQRGGLESNKSMLSLTLRKNPSSPKGMGSTPMMV